MRFLNASSLSIVIFLIVCLGLYVNIYYRLHFLKKPKENVDLIHSQDFPSPRASNSLGTKDDHLNVWIIFTKAATNAALLTKFRTLANSIFLHTRGVSLHLNIISDKVSQNIAKKTLSMALSEHRKDCTVKITYYSAKENARKIADIVKVMTPHFSSQPGSYYSDALFFMSLGLYRLAPHNQNRVVLLDCDLQFKVSIEKLFQQFDEFLPSNIIGMARELTSVYRHVLYNYRRKHKDTAFGSEIDYYKKNTYNNSSELKIPNQKYVNNINYLKEENSAQGFPGYNSGVVLLDLHKIRHSVLYQSLLKNESVKYLTAKYYFKGHLGDQDFYTLLGYERPDLFYNLDCGWNRQLCKWWKRYEDGRVFDDYFKCDSPVNIYHGNCNTAIPRD